MLLIRDTIFQQLTNRLKQLLKTGEFETGAKFPTEREIATRFQVSRPTANKALAALVAEGLLEFRKGIGTFVASNRLDYDLRHLVSFTDRALAAGKQPSTRVLRFERVVATAVPADVRAALHAADEDELYFIERVRSADREPMIFEQRWVSVGLCPGLCAADAKGSLYGTWSQRLGLDIAGADQFIRAARATKTEAALLKIPRGTAVLAVRATGYLLDGRPLWNERTLYRADRYEFHTRLGTLQNARPAVGQFA